MVERYEYPCPDDGSPIESAQVRATARAWATSLNNRGICDVDADDLRHEAWINAKPHFDAGRVRQPVAYLRSAIRTAALQWLRRNRGLTIDPNEWPLAGRAEDERGFDEVETMVRLRETLVFLQTERALISARLRRRLGTHERLDQIWAAALMAVRHLMLGQSDSRQAWDLREVLMYCMTRSSAYWEAACRPGDDVARTAEMRRKRVSRDLPFVSYLAVWEGMSQAFQDDQRALRPIAARHLEMLRILQREWRNQAARLGPLEEHIAEVRRAAGTDETRPPASHE